jgi:hypothetical protein
MHIFLAHVGPLGDYEKAGNWDLPFSWQEEEVDALRIARQRTNELTERGMCILRHADKYLLRHLIGDKSLQAFL